METSESHELDLPLMSNVDDIYVKHYVLDLLCDFEAKLFSGTVILFCEPGHKCMQSGISKQQESSPVIPPRLPVSGCSESDVIPPKLPALLAKKNSCQLFFDNKAGNPACGLGAEAGLSYSMQSYSETTSQQNVVLKDNVGQKMDENTYVDVLVEHSYSQFKTPSAEHGQSNLAVNAEEHVHELDGDGPYTSENSATPFLLQSDRVHPNKKLLTGHEINSPETKHPIEPANQFPRCKQIDDEHSDQTAKLMMVLDSWDLNVDAVDQICEPSGGFSSYRNSDIKMFAMPEQLKTVPLSYVNEKKCLKIWKDGVSHWEEFPMVVRITYKTSPSGQSLKWTLDQDGKPCVYTHGHWINNRSLFPSQDVPVAMATWSARIHVPRESVVLMSGDENPRVTKYAARQGYQTYSYFTKMEMPSSTLALAVGHWSSVDIIDEAAVTRESSSTLLPCRLFSPSSHLATAQALLQSFMPRCMEGAQWLLGPHPFSRLDVLVVPSSFASLGMASPSLMFLSQSVLSADGGMLVRVAHEISHSWFGLLIGPRDWHEEWLSEGFCTYTEGIIHARCMQWTEEEARQRANLQDYLKYKTLEAEINSTQQELQTLRNEEQTTAENGVTYVKNGMNPDKGFMQCHYLKGYFLLRYLEAQVGEENFRKFLRMCVQQFHHKLITSRDVFLLFIETFSQDQRIGITLDSLQEWLDKPGMPPELQKPTLEDILHAEPVLKLVKHIKRLQETYTKLHWRKKQKFDLRNAISFNKLTDDQLVILLELLIDEEKIHLDILQSLNEVFTLNKRCPDILHRWCELVVQNRVQPCYNDVQHFLINHQAMGVYLFGELMVTRDPVQRKLALVTFETIKHEMEEGTCKTVSTMLCTD